MNNILALFIQLFSNAMKSPLYACRPLRNKAPSGTKTPQRLLASRIGLERVNENVNLCMG